MSNSINLSYLNNRYLIAKRNIENTEKSIRATGFEPVIQCSQSTQYAICDSTLENEVRLQLLSWYNEHENESQKAKGNSKEQQDIAKAFESELGKEIMANKKLLKTLLGKKLVESMKKNAIK